MVTNKKNLSGEKNLADCIRKYPCLYDKSLVDYKSASCKETAWRNVEKELEIENGIICYMLRK